MLSSEERWLIIGVLALLLFGGLVKLWRDRVTEQDVAKVQMPSVESSASSGASAR
jgi:hypothetical protein